MIKVQLKLTDLLAAALCSIITGGLFYGCNSGNKIILAAPKEESAVSAASAGDTAKKITTILPSAHNALSDDLSPGTQLLLSAIDNALETLPSADKKSEILLLKGQTFYNLKYFAEARPVYNKIIDDFPKSTFKAEAIRMIGQSYYEEKDFEKASEWYKKLRDIGGSGENRAEAETRLAESMYRLAENHRKNDRIHDAIKYFERVSTEYPKSPLAGPALYNAGLLFEEKKDWNSAILKYTLLKKDYPKVDIMDRAFFKLAKCYENVMDYEQAARIYLNYVETYKETKLAKNAMINAGICYEKMDKPSIAAGIFEKYATIFPQADDAPDVLFKAGEMFGKLEDWENVERVNRLFGEKYGKDKDRVIQAMCMSGVASFMQKKYTRALDQFNKTINIYKEISNPSRVQKFYAAKTEFTMGKIYKIYSEEIKLVMPNSVYQRNLKEKSNYLSRAVELLSNVVGYGFLEWSTNAFYEIGNSFEIFGVDLCNRQIPDKLLLDKLVSIKMGVANAVEEYLVDKAVKYYEKCVMVGIQYKVENEWVLKSREQLTKLPTIAGANFMELTQYLVLSESKTMTSTELLRYKLKTLQEIAPFQSRAINIYLKTLEVGSKYQIDDKYVKLAASEITKTSYEVGRTYWEIVEIARSAKIPGNYSAYERFLYKVQLIQEHLGIYEEQALSSFIKNIKIKEAYGIDDEWIQKSISSIAQMLFERGYCYEYLARLALNDPPLPGDITSEEERAEIMAQMEDLGFRLEDEAKAIYRDIVNKSKAGMTGGKYLDLAYVHAYKMLPKEIGSEVEKDTTVVIPSGPLWRYHNKEIAGWVKSDFNPADWKIVRRGVNGDTMRIVGFVSKTPKPM
ncbi:MAG: tetratricopeptide repeat protein, partial [bacterium]